jgi:signal transduction histidine kinase
METALTAVSIVAEAGRGRAIVQDAAELEAKLLFEQLLIMRHWNAAHGGVFVPVTASVQPSPWLSHKPDRDAYTVGGRALTLMNPAWMTREILDLTNSQLRVSGHITSRDPVRLENAPDPWERQALARLEGGRRYYSELDGNAGAERLRFMGRLDVEERCLGCHADQGYRIGDVRGGIAINVPLEPLLGLGIDDTRRQLVVHGVIWLLGAAGIGLAFRDHRRRAAAAAVAERRKAEAEAELAAARRLEAVGRLSAGVAHDFNNLLAPILSVAGVVRDELPANSPLRADLDEIRSAAGKARDLIRTLQTLSRKNGAKLERIPVGVALAESEEFLRRFAGTRFGFVVRLGEEVPAVMADRALLELALANLVVNAREGAVRGRVIAIEAAPLVVSPADAARLNIRPGRHAAVTVAEAAVPAELLAGLSGFEPVQASASADPGGAGVGMPTINGIAAQYGGGVIAREAPGAGWILRLLLPEAQPDDD